VVKDEGPQGDPQLGKKRYADMTDKQKATLAARRERKTLAYQGEWPPKDDEEFDIESIEE
jgi:hypothetical protein